MRVTAMKAPPSLDHPQVTIKVELRMSYEEAREFQLKHATGDPIDDAISECLEEHHRTKYKCSRMTEGH